MHLNESKRILFKKRLLRSLKIQYVSHHDEGEDIFPTGGDKEWRDGTLTICLVPQMVKSIELHYQDMLPLPHASEDVVDELVEVQITVGSPSLLSTTPRIA